MLQKLFSRAILIDILMALICAIMFSAFIYLQHYFEVSFKLLNTLFALSSLAMLLYMPKRAILIAGFFIGLFWFYWIGYSFKYNGVGYLEPLITLIFGIVYMLFFGVLALSKQIYIRAILLFLLSFFAPFDFNWMVVELPFVDSYLGVQKYHYAIILFAITLPYYIKKYRLAPLILLIFALQFSQIKQEDAPLKIDLVSTNISQDQKWLSKNLNSVIEFVFSEIKRSTKEGYDVVVFPESVLPLYLNDKPMLLEVLKLASKDIAIVVGSLFREGDKHYNVTYIFDNGEYKVAKKVVLVPFGEYVPLPSFLKQSVNEIFFAGASDFVSAKEPSDFTIKGVEFRNAICYEATTQIIYDDKPRFVIATSNNAWFAPSIEPTLQKLLMQYFARKNGTTIYHSANYKGSGIIK